MSPITSQPAPSHIPRVSRLEQDLPPHSTSAHTRTHQHHACHTARLRRVVLPALFLLLTAAALVFLEIGAYDSGMNVGAGAGGGLLRRATDSGSNTPFVKNKLYLIVVLVGLFLVLVAGIMLAGWCCRGAFENPLCCPCYLCACCGGLACLECISCGLCAEGFEDLNV